MLNFMLLDFFNDMVNTVFRDISPALRYSLVLVFLAVGFFFLARSLNKKKDTEGKEPIKYGKLFLAIVFIGLAFAFAFIR